MTAYGLLQAKCGTILRQDQIEIYIDVPFEPLKLPERLAKAFIEVSNKLLNMSATWVPTAEGAFSSGLMAVGTTIAVSSLALAGQDSTADFPGRNVLKKIFDLFPSSVKKWFGEYVKSKSRPKQTKRSSFLTRKELSSIFAAAWVITFANSYVRSTNTVQILLLIPYVLGTSVLIELAKDLTAKATARIHGISSEFRFCYLGLAVFALSTIFFKTPISSPKKVYYESEKSTNRSRGIVSTVVVLMPLMIFAAFYVLFLNGFTFFGNMGMTICLTSALNDSIPLQPMNGKNIYTWNKTLWVCLFAGSFFFYLLQFFIF